MWLIFGAGAIITALLNIIDFKNRADIFRFLSLAFTILTVCGFLCRWGRKSNKRRLGRLNGYHANHI